MKSKRLAVIALIAAMVLSMSGCGETKEAPKQDKEASSEVAKGADNLKDAYKDNFSFGVAVNTFQLRDAETLAQIKKDFNSITLENEMKPENVLDWEGCENSSDGMPKIKEDKLKAAMKVVQDTGLKLRGHTLVWHQQTPRWFFCEDYDESKDLVDKETMSKRLESYIKQVVTCCQEDFPGVLYAWDVVNEVVADGGGYREDGSLWYEIFGEEYVEKAFEYARKYAAKDVKLFFLDYNCYETDKRDTIFEIVSKLREKNLVDGIGMQSHWLMDYPSVHSIESAIEKFSEIKGLEIQMPEIDMHTTGNDEAALKAQAERYGEIFEVFKELDKKTANITNVTFWGLNDKLTWLTNFKGETSYPLLFDENNEKKPVYNTLLEIGNKK